MEFAVALFLLYALQCSVSLPRGCVLFVRFFGSCFERAGPGFALVNPRPSSWALVGSRLPLRLHEGTLYTPGAPSWWRASGLQRGGPRFDPSAAEPVEARGRIVWAGSRRLARGLSPAHGAQLARFLEGLRGLEGEALQRRVGERLAASFDVDALRAAIERARHALRWLDVVLDLYALLAFLALPGAVLLFGAEPVLWRALPLLLLLHLGALACYALAQRRLEPGGRGELFEALMATSLYPPLLLRAGADLGAASAPRFHPAAVACVAFPREQALALLRRELMHCRAARASDWLRAGERAGLESLAAALGESPASLFAPPPRQDALASGFCPACRVEYRRAEGECTDCGATLEAFAR